MPLTPAISVVQPAGAPEIVRITDTSTGSDAAITQRRVYLQTSTGTYLVESGTTTDYEEWAYADSVINLDVLLKDYALALTVQWLDVDDVVLYELEDQLYLFYQYTDEFYYGLIQNQASVPPIVADVSYFRNVMVLKTYIDQAISATTYNDIAAAQNALNRAYFMMQNQNQYF
jgi:hypothetical protein